MLEPYELDPEPLEPNLPGTVVLRDSPDDLLDALAADILAQAYACVRHFGDFHLALSGGPELEPLYRRLMYDPVYRQLPWRRTHVWIVEEHRRANGDGRYESLRELIVTHSDIPESQAHPIRTDHEHPDRAYEAELQENLEWREKGHDRLDFVLLALDDEGGVGALCDTDPQPTAAGSRLVLATDEQVGLSVYAVNAARCIAVYAPGERTRGIIAALDQREPGALRLPVAKLSPMAGNLRWYVDREACTVGEG